MRAWLEQPVTRAEVIGWVLAVPAVIYIGVLGETLVNLLRTTDHAAAGSGFVPAFLAACLRLGESGMTAVFVFCAVIALGAQLTRQRPLLRVVAPLVGVLLAHAVSVQYVTSMTELMLYRGASLGAAAGDATPVEDGPR
jgi:hypothetical protein